MLFIESREHYLQNYIITYWVTFIQNWHSMKGTKR